MKKNLQENIVPSENQNKSDVFLHDHGKTRIMFVGNSITKHAPKEVIGWHNDCGMASTSIDKDYVHLLLDKFNKHYGEEVSWCIVQVASFERNLNPENIDKFYKEVKDYNPDIMIMFFGANVDKEYDSDENPEFKFGDSYEKLRNYLAGPNTLVFHSEGYYIRHVLDKEKEAVATKYGDPFIKIDDIRNREDTHGLFNHPNDFGMAEIAGRFWEIIRKALFMP